MSEIWSHLGVVQFGAIYIKHTFYKEIIMAKGYKKTDGNINPPNTIAILETMGHAKLFDEKVFNEAGFEVVEMTAQAEVALGEVCRSELELFPGFNIAVLDNQKRRYKIPTIRKNFNETISRFYELAHKDTALLLKTFTLRKNDNVYLFKISGQNVKTVLLNKKNGIPHHMWDVDDLMKELADLFERTCFAQKGEHRAPIICDYTTKP